ncbi:hypothetical protein ACFTY8_39990 [Streptomyces mirabilis]|uniref:hypothetical protein n=1 Tax=Streptomyces mirabilis TaxID=68239 RepID=UPI00362A5405
MLVHQLTPALKVIRVSAPCEAEIQTTTCRYGSLAASSRREGDAMDLVRRGYVRLSIDEVVWQRLGSPSTGSKSS